MKTNRITPHLLACLTLGTGCGTVFNGTTQDIFIDSRPSGAAVSISGMSAGTTPMATELKRKSGHLVVVEKDGYSPAGVPIERRIAWIPMLMNVIIWPLFFVDFALGGAYELRPSQIFVELELETDESPSHGGGVTAPIGPE